jgi:hypothetical protein
VRSMASTFQRVPSSVVTIRATGARMLAAIEYPKPAAKYADAADRLAA